VPRDMQNMLLCSRGGCTYEVPAGGKLKPGDKCPQCGRGTLCRWQHETASLRGRGRQAQGGARVAQVLR